MILKTLYLRNVRCYKEVHFEFSKGVNLIAGPNALGKTTVLEAIFLLIAARSFRTAQLRELIREGEPFFYLEAHFESLGIDHTIRYYYSEEKRQVTVNHTTYPNLMSLVGMLRGVSTTPEDLALIKGGPQERRSYLDLQLSQVHPLYVHHLQRYHQALKQRNLLLRRRQAGALDCWEESLAQSAHFIVRQRMDLLAQLEPQLRSELEGLAGQTEQISLHYRGSFSSAKSIPEIRSRYLEARPKELELGFTLIGPHRDDVAIRLQGREARHFASEGQQRTVAQALRLAEWTHMRTQTQEAPLLLLDEAGIGLDSERRNKLLAQLPQKGQVFLTTTENFQSFIPSQEIKALNIRECVLQRS